jgi:hypothetical protein
MICSGEITMRRILYMMPMALFLVVAGYVLGSRQQAVRAASSPVYELRTYHCFPGKLPNLLTRFREHTMTIFKRHGMHNVAYFVPTDEPQKSNTLIYIISHASLAQAKKNWDEFRSDPEWKKVAAASEANGKIVEKIDSTYMEATDFSPIK